MLLASGAAIPTGQFTSLDPAVAKTLAPYGYASGNPVNTTDPDGLCAKAAPGSPPVDCAANNGSGDVGGHGTQAEDPCVAAGDCEQQIEQIIAQETPPRPKPRPRPTTRRRLGDLIVLGALLRDGLDSYFGSIRKEFDQPQAKPKPGSIAAILQPLLGVVINGISYGGHAIDEMQSEGFMPSVVQDAIENGQETVGPSGRVSFYSQANNITVIMEDGRVVTVSSGMLKVR